ncbi:MAG TPA: hypothetical protein VHF02_07675 [Luteimonas sp.]|nr:hypothetical protein [Luteimonas sp.]
MRLASRSSILLCAATLLLGGCNSSVPAPATMPYAETGVHFAVTPVGADCGPDGQYTANVEWELPAAMSPRIEIQLDAQERKVFARSDERKGSEKTGQWVKPGLAFYLLDRQADRVIAALDAGSSHCVTPLPAR